MKTRAVLATVMLVAVVATASTCKSSTSKPASKPPVSSTSTTSTSSAPTSNAPASGAKSPSASSSSSASSHPSSSSSSSSPAQPAKLGSGTLIVGKDIQPGTYKALASGLLGGYWEREKDASGSVDSILANDNVSKGEQAVVTIAATDYAFKSTGFSGWVPASGPSLTGGKLGSGTLIVGQDIQPGTYKATATDISGYWARMKDDLGSADSILANDIVGTGEQAVVTISASDAAFKSTGFTDWTKVS